jgi:mono/diheme cytochrome c family protein
MDDPSAFVRRQLTATFGAYPADARVAPILEMIARHGDDPMIIDAAISGLRGQEEAVLSQLLGTNAPNLDAVAMLTATVTKRREAASVQRLLELAVDGGRATPQRVALLTGAAAGLRGGPALFGGAVAGGRAGAGGPAIARPVREFDVPARPAALAALADGTGNLADAARTLLPMFRWPGKPATAGAPAPAQRTPEQEQLFARGKALYATDCQGCHGEQGQGIANVGAALAASRLVNADPSVGMRILTAGKEGTIGLMPPAGQTMSDEDLAAVLTFVRGSWGNPGAPLSPAEVKTLRARYAERTTPWTDAELQAPPAR